MSVLALAVGLTIAASPAPPTSVVPPRLVGVLAPAGATFGRRDIRRTVIVQLVVGVDGTPSELSVVQGAGEPWDSQAIARLKAARFTPALRDGAPIAVRINAPVPFGRVPGWSGLGRRGPEAVPRVEQGIAGQILERGSGTPLDGVPVQLGRGDALTVVTDAKGRFAFRNLVEGKRYNIVVPGFDYEGYDAPHTAPSSLVIRLEPRPNRRFRTVVRPSSVDASRILVPVERAREIPGSNGDPFKVVEALPGAARPAAAGPGAGQLIVRGSAPEDTRFYVDGLPLFQLYHFGNLYSVLADAWIDNIDFRPGGIPIDQGDAIGGYLGATLKDIPNDGVHGHLDLNIYHAAALVTAPISDEWTVGLAFRRSWIDAVLGAVLSDDDGFNFAAAPRYYDYQARADWRPNERVNLRLLVFGSDDLVEVDTGEPSATDPGDVGFKLRRFFHQVQGRLDIALSNDLSLSAGLATSYQKLLVSPGDNDLEITFDPLVIRADLDWRASPDLRIRGGILGDVTRFDVLLNVPRPVKEGQVSLPGEARSTFMATDGGITGQLGLWTEATYKATETVGLSAGTRLTGWFGTFESWAPDARLGAWWDLGADTRLTLNLALNHQQPQPDEWAESIGNPDLSPERALGVTLGGRQQIGENFSIDLQVYGKALDNLVSPTDDRAGIPYDNAGTGTVIGGELLARVQASQFDGWIAYTLSRSQRVDRPGEASRPFSFDQTHVLAMVIGYDLGNNWNVGGRFRYTTGNPYTPLEAAYFDAGADVYVPKASGAPLSGRVADFIQLDLRISKLWYFDTWRLKLYLELNNATNRENIENVLYKDDYSGRDDIVSLPLTPSFGVRGSF